MLTSQKSGYRFRSGKASAFWFCYSFTKPLYSTLLMEGKLNGYLHNIDEQAREMVDSIVGQMAEQRGVNENLKVREPMHWVQEMNLIQNEANEIVNREIIFS